MYVLGIPSRDPYRIISKGNRRQIMGKVKSAKAAEKKRQRQLAAQAAKRVKESIKAAYAVEDPLTDLEPFLAFDIAPSDAVGEKALAPAGLRSPTSAANGPTANGAEDDVTKPADKVPVKVSFHSSPLPVDLHFACLDLFKANMSDMYQASSWGLDLDEKSSELRHETARFLVVEAAADSDGAGSDGGSIGRDILGFVHFRFEPNDDEKPTEEVLYVYEIQVSGRAQRSGLGKRLMNVMELVAHRNGMQKVMLTVFKNNGGAMKFYRDKLTYGIDESSPSNFDGEVADYEILSKVVGKKKE
jgi:ribosomal protein S18 acetylase RimI-like enzyme